MKNPLYFEMNLEFRRISEFPRGTLCALLADAYSFDCRCARHWGDDWREFDGFFFDNPRIADRCGFISVLGGRAAGFASWDPRRLPEYTAIGHNCIAAEFKGRGCGAAQLREAVARILREKPARITVTTSGLLVPAQRMYESAGFREFRRREDGGFAGELIDYEYRLRPERPDGNGPGRL